MTEPTPREKDKDKLIQIIGNYGGTSDTSPRYEKAKAELMTGCIEDLITSIDKNSDSSQKLATKIYWLNVILTSATVIGTFVAVLNLFFKNGD